MSLNISNFILFFFFLKKVIPSFPANPLSKLRSCQAPLSKIFGRRFELLLAERQGEGGEWVGGAHYAPPVAASGAGIFHE